MARDPLRILLSVRLRSVEQARFTLAACAAAEAAITDGIRALDEAARRDRDIGRTWPDAHQFQETFAIRLQAGRVQREAMMADLAAASVELEQARSVVAAERAAAEAVEQLIAERDAASLAEAARRDQHGLDDIARSAFARRRRDGSTAS